LGIDRKKLYEAYESEAEHPLGHAWLEVEQGIIGQDHHVRWFFIQYLLGIRLQPKDLILDLGCWNAGQTVKYAQLSDVVGIDISYGKLKQAQAGRHPHIRYIQADWDNLPLKQGSVDWCIWDEGIEHAEDPAKVLVQLSIMIRKGIIVGTPLGPDAAVPLTYKYLKGEIQLWTGGHLHEFTEEKLRQLMEKYFKVETVHTVKHSFPGYQWLVGIGEVK